MNKKLKKGFTLAELLIVVAIIAVLTAIAVPLFVTSLNKAQKAADDATFGAVRSAASVYILNADKPVGDVNDPNEKIYTYDSSSKTWTLEGPWKAIGTVDSKGNVTEITVEKVEAAGTDAITKGDAGAKTVTVYLSVTTLKAAAAAAGPGA